MHVRGAPQAYSARETWWSGSRDTLHQPTAPAMLTERWRFRLLTGIQVGGVVVKFMLRASATQLAPQHRWRLDAPFMPYVCNVFVRPELRYYHEQPFWLA